MADIGIQPHIIEAALNHVSGHKAGVAGIYNRSSYQREVKNALAICADHVASIASIVSGEERKILQFPAEQGGGERRESAAGLLTHRNRRVGVAGDAGAKLVREALADGITAGNVAADVQCRT